MTFPLLLTEVGVQPQREEQACVFFPLLQCVPGIWLPSVRKILVQCLNKTENLCWSQTKYSLSNKRRISGKGADGAGPRSTLDWSLHRWGRAGGCRSLMGKRGLQETHPGPSDSFQCPGSGGLSKDNLLCSVGRLQRGEVPARGVSPRRGGQPWKREVFPQVSWHVFFTRLPQGGWASLCLPCLCFPTLSFHLGSVTARELLHLLTKAQRSAPCPTETSPSSLTPAGLSHTRQSAAAVRSAGVCTG